MDQTGSGEENTEEHNADFNTRDDGTLPSSSGSSSGLSTNPAPQSSNKLFRDFKQPLEGDSCILWLWRLLSAGLYTQSPMEVHLATTGRQTVYMNLNLFNDEKVCLSVPSSWQGCPEEKWHSHTYSLILVLCVEPVSSDPMVSETYFIEPVCEQSRGTPSGNLNCRDYDVNILQAANKWTMMEQVKNPAPGFKEVNLFINLSFFLSGSSLIDFILHRWVKLNCG